MSHSRAVMRVISTDEPQVSSLMMNCVFISSMSGRSS